MPDSTRGLGPVVTSRTVTSGDVVALDMGRIVSVATRRAGSRSGRASRAGPRCSRLPASCCPWQGAAVVTTPTLTDGTVTLRPRADDSGTPGDGGTAVDNTASRPVIDANGISAPGALRGSARRPRAPDRAVSVVRSGRAECVFHDLLIEEWRATRAP